MLISKQVYFSNSYYFSSSMLWKFLVGIAQQVWASTSSIGIVLSFNFLCTVNYLNLSKTTLVFICFSDIFHIQYCICSKCSTRLLINTILQYLNICILYHLVTCLLTLRHSLYLFPKPLLSYPNIIPQSLSLSPVCHFFRTLTAYFTTSLFTASIP